MTDSFQVAEVKLTYRTKVKASDRPQVSRSADAYRIFWRYWSEDIEMVEEVYVLLLNRANRVLGIVPISRGGQAGTVVDAKMVFVPAVKALATSVVLAHNHPSGHLWPSQADIDLTKRLQSAGQTLDILVQDHLILSPDGEHYYSFADEGLI